MSKMIFLFLFSIAFLHSNASVSKKSDSVGNLIKNPPTLLGGSLPEGEKALYIKIVESYQQGDLVKLLQLKNILLSYYPTSIHCDNALYLLGSLEFQKGKIAESIHTFSTLIEHFPSGNKRPAALYAKSMAYSKLNLPQISQKILSEIVKTYPGSPESQRAWIDLRLLQSPSVKN
ncbi:MAG: tetratricopeptide repeat protein [Bdellovibrionales bacterium]|nr:tetratricopeptide repeat protein [Bdellovibrionales bacterium]